MKLAYLIEVETDDLEVARINEGRKRMGTQLWEPSELAVNALSMGLDQKFIKAKSIRFAPVQLVQQRVGDEVL